MVFQLDSRENPKVKHFIRLLNNGKYREEQGLFAIEGVSGWRERWNRHAIVKKSISNPPGNDKGKPAVRAGIFSESGAGNGEYAGFPQKAAAQRLMRFYALVSVPFSGASWYNLQTDECI